MTAPWGGRPAAGGGGRLIIILVGPLFAVGPLPVGAAPSQGTPLAEPIEDGLRRAESGRVA